MNLQVVCILFALLRVIRVLRGERIFGMHAMKFVVVKMQHETNTFSPVPTAWEEFGPKGPYLGRDAFEAMQGKGMAMAAFLDLAAKVGAEVITPVAAWANPTGPVDATPYDRISH